jgi:hypothetical protein
VITMFITITVILVGILVGILFLVLWYVFPQFLINWKNVSSIKYQPQLFPMLDQDECQKIFDDVLQLKEYWKPFPNPLGIEPLFYLGAAKYIERKENYIYNYQKLKPHSF